MVDWKTRRGRWETPDGIDKTDSVETTEAEARLKELQDRFREYGVGNLEMKLQDAEARLAAAEKILNYRCCPTCKYFVAPPTDGSVWDACDRCKTTEFEMWEPAWRRS
jgi:hypothetical protein